MALNARQHGWVTGRGLQQVAPGLYVDEIGWEYFYLTGIYVLLAPEICNQPLLNTPSFVSRVLDGVRCELESVCRTELMD